MLLCTLSIAQSSNHISTAQGLETNQLTILIKAKDNSMWFGSYNGLHHHEGTSIKVYNKSGKDSTSLSSKEMHALYEDRLGFIWVGTTGGLDKLNPKTGIIKHYKLKLKNSDDDRIGYIVSIFQDDEDYIWICTEVGLFKLNYKSGVYTVVAIDESNKGIPSFAMLYKTSVKTNKGIWFFASGYLIYYDFESKSFFHQFHNPKNKPIFSLNKTKLLTAQSEMCIDVHNNLYFVFNHNTLVKYNIQSEKIDTFHFTTPENAWKCCYSLATDYKGNVWIGFRYGGIIFFDNTTHQFSSIRYDGANSLIKSDYIYSLCEDYLHRMWATTNNGAFVIDYYDTAVQQTYLSDKKEFININYPASIISQDNIGNIYIPFKAGGLFKYNVFTKRNQHFEIPKEVEDKYGYTFVDENNKTFINSISSLKASSFLKNKIMLKYSKLPAISALNKSKSNIVWAYVHNNKSIYFKNFDGQFYYFDGTKNLESFTSTGFYKQACVSQDNKYFYYLNENADLSRRDLHTLKSETFPLSKKLQEIGFTYANNRDIADDGNGNIWITSQNGLIKYRLADSTVAVYTTSDGLLHDFSFTLCVDKKKRLWIGSMGGVNLYDKTKNEFVNVFSESKDKLSNYFASSLEGKDGHIYFLFGGKLVNIDAEQFLKQEKLKRKIALYELQVNGKPMLSNLDKLNDLPYNYNRIYARFGLLEFAEAEKVNYMYQLIGDTDSWIDLGNKSEITFNALNPGDYVLKIRGSDVYGNTLNQILVVPFNIHLPFWKTWWFVGYTLLAVSFLVTYFFKWRERNLTAIAEEKMKVHQLNAEQYKSQFEFEQITNYFTSSLIDKNTHQEVLADVAKNLIGQLGFVDCMIYMWNDDKTKMVQMTGFGSKSSEDQLKNQPFDVMPGQGIVGSVIQSKEAIVVQNTELDARYRADDIHRKSEIAVPIIYNNDLVGVLDSEHPEINFFTSKHLQLLTTIATLTANKLNAIDAEKELHKKQIENYSIKEQLSKAKLEALRSQMNPHFIFNSLNAIQECILTNKVDAAYEYLSKFSKLQRMVLNYSEKELISLTSEIEMLNLYLSLESLRFSKSFSYNIDSSCIHDIDEIMMPSLVTQPLVENAIWHGLRSKEGDKSLTIRYEEKEGLLFVTVEDNGIGREKAIEIKKQKLGNEQYASKATIILQNRLQVLSQQIKAEIKLDIVDKVDEVGNAAGTKVIMIFPSNLEMS
jgi:LytS/YehU family sensor histidine kinase/ligand-binding sensor domain-containing protein